MEKPPLGYWAVAASGRLFGGVTEWTARIPAAVSAVLLSILVGVWARRWYGSAAGWAAALIQMTSVYVIMFARKAEVDMLLCSLVVFALFLIADQPKQESRGKAFWRWAGIYTVLGISWLAKFHYGLTMALVPFVVFCLAQRRMRSLWQLVNPVGWLILAAFVLAWPWLVWQQLPEAWAIWQEQTIGRALGELGREPIWFYIPHVLNMTLPWTPLAIWVIPQSWRRAWRDGDSHERFLWIWFLTHFAFVSINANKHPHYVMAALPALSILFGRAVAGFFSDTGVSVAYRMRPQRATILTVLILGGLISAAALGIQEWPNVREAIFVLSLVMSIGLVLGIRCLTLGQNRTAAGLGMVLFLFCYVTVTGWIIPGRDHRLSVAQFAASVRNQHLQADNVCIYRLGTTPIVFYIGGPLERVESKQQLAARLAQQGELFVVTAESHAMHLPQMGQCELIETMRVPPDAAAPKHPRLVLARLQSVDPAQAYPGEQLEIARPDDSDQSRL